MLASCTPTPRRSNAHRRQQVTPAVRNLVMRTSSARAGSAHEMYAVTPRRLANLAVELCTPSLLRAGVHDIWPQPRAATPSPQVLRTSRCPPLRARVACAPCHLCSRGMQRFPSFLGGLALEAAAGSGYAFSVYSPQVKAALNLSESDIQTVGTVGNVGSYLGLVPGLVYDAAGPQVTAGVGAALSCLGYVLMWRALAGSLPASRSMLSLYSFIWAQGGVWMDVAGVWWALCLRVPFVCSSPRRAATCVCLPPLASAACSGGDHGTQLRGGPRLGHGPHQGAVWSLCFHADARVRVHVSARRDALHHVLCHLHHHVRCSGRRV
ncbi:MAG: hypothetical protein EOO41_01215 [Methanobacteriota archaeon]|nr:MAG: hypothetical protein EOO41_01215 [Euryarchaeota archaeon]